MSNPDQNDAELENSPTPTSIPSIGSSIIPSISNTPKLEIHDSVSLSTEVVIGDETNRNGDVLRNSPIPALNYPIGSPITGSVSNNLELENQGSVSRSTEEVKKRRRLGDEIDQNDDGFKTPTDSDHRIPVPVQCPPAPRKPSLRKSKSPPATVTETRRSLLPVDVSDDEADSLFPLRVEDEVGPTKVKRRRRDDDVA